MARAFTRRIQIVLFVYTTFSKNFLTLISMPLSCGIYLCITPLCKKNENQTSVGDFL